MRAVDRNKVCAIKHIPIPGDITQVQSILGMCGYHRQYVKDQQLIALPLKKLSQASEALQWTEARQIHFQHLKEKLKLARGLSLPDYTKGF